MNIRLRALLLMMFFVVLPPLLPASNLLIKRQCLPNVSWCVEEPFLQFWSENGGAAVFGYPIGAATWETTADGTVLAQRFERQRLEWRPTRSNPRAIVLDRSGVERLARSGRDWNAFPRNPADPIAHPSTGAGCERFAGTGFEVCEPFISAWRQRGLELDGRPGFTNEERLALWGAPISPPLWETNSSGDRVIAQWFERARFEWHQQHAGTQHEVMIGRIGAELAVEADRPDGSLVRAEQLFEYQDGTLTPWVARGVNYNPAWAPWALWERWDEALVSRDLDRAAALNINVVRVPLPWRVFRSSSPHSAAARASFARFVELARIRNLRVIPILFNEFCKSVKPDGSHCWQHWRWDDETRELAEALPKQFSRDPTIALWEITNEPGWVTEAEWTWSEHRENRLRWLKQAAAAIRSAAPYQPLTIGVSFVNEARDVVTAGASETVTLHYYTEIHRGRGPLSDELDHLAGINLPILISEAGFSSSAQLNGSEQQQAELLCGVLQEARRRQAGLLWWHLQAWADEGWESQLGLYRADGSPKPAADILAGRLQCGQDVTTMGRQQTNFDL